MLLNFKLIAALVIVILSWAYSPIGIKLSLSSYSATHLALARFVIASSVLLLLAAARGIQPLKPKDLPHFMLLGFFAVSLHHLCLNLAQQWISASASSILAQSTPLFSALLSSCVFKQRISAQTYWSLLLGFIGAIVVCCASSSSASAFDWQGLWAIGAAISWSIYFILQQKLLLEYDSFSSSCYSIWWGSACLLIYLPGLPADISLASGQANLALIILGIFPSALAYICWAYILSQVHLMTASLFLYCVPLCAMLMAAILLDESISPLLGLGGLLILASLLIIRRQPAPAAQRA
jgi:drug/metabolite transporter (DMT)-like permease